MSSDTTDYVAVVRANPVFAEFDRKVNDLDSLLRLALERITALEMAESPDVAKIAEGQSRIEAALTAHGIQ